MSLLLLYRPLMDVAVKPYHGAVGSFRRQKTDSKRKKKKDIKDEFLKNLHRVDLPAFSWDEDEDFEDVLLLLAEFDD